MRPSRVSLLFLRLSFFWSFYQPLVSDCPLNATVVRSVPSVVNTQRLVPARPWLSRCPSSYPSPAGATPSGAGPPITISTKSTASPANAHHRLPPSTACEVCAASCTLRCARPLDKESFRATQAGSSPVSIRAAPWPASANTATRELSVRKSTERRTNVHCGPQKREVPGGA